MLMETTHDVSFQVVVGSAGSILKLKHTHLYDVYLRIRETRIAAKEIRHGHYFLRRVVLAVVRCPQLGGHLHHHVVEVACHGDVVDVSLGDVIARVVPVMMSGEDRELFPARKISTLSSCTSSSHSQAKALPHAAVCERLGLDFDGDMVDVPRALDGIEFMPRNVLLRILINGEIKPKLKGREKA